MSILNGEERYLGDAVFVSFDGYQLKLRCEAPSADGVIYLNPEVYEGLSQFVHDLRREATTAEEARMRMGDEG